MPLLWFGAQYLVKVHPAGPYDVEVEVVERNATKQQQPLRMLWEEAYRALMDELGVNDHQIAAMAPRLNRGKVLKFYLKCTREDLLRAGFLQQI